MGLNGSVSGKEARYINEIIINMKHLYKFDQHLNEGKPGYNDWHMWGGPNELAQSLSKKMSMMSYNTELMDKPGLRGIFQYTPIEVKNVSDISQIEETLDLIGETAIDILDLSDSTDFDTFNKMVPSKGFYVLTNSATLSSVDRMNVLKKISKEGYSVFILVNKNPMSKEEISQSIKYANLAGSVRIVSDPGIFIFI